MLVYSFMYFEDRIFFSITRIIHPALSSKATDLSEVLWKKTVAHTSLPSSQEKV